MTFIKQFLNDFCLFDERVAVPRGVFRARYHEWCQKEDMYEYSDKELQTILAQLNVRSTTTTLFGKCSRIFRGVTLVDWWAENGEKVTLHESRS